MSMSACSTPFQYLSILPYSVIEAGKSKTKIADVPCRVLVNGSS